MTLSFEFKRIPFYSGLTEYSVCDLKFSFNTRRRGERAYVLREHLSPRGSNHEAVTRQKL